MDGYLCPLYTGGNILGCGMRELPHEPVDGYLAHPYTNGNILACGMRELPPEPINGYLCPLYTGGKTSQEMFWVVLIRELPPR